MRLAISNIAWPSGADDVVAPVLLEEGAEGVEIAPTKVWPRPLDASAKEIRNYRESWERRGLPIVALQSLLFGRPELQLFGVDAARRATVAYLKGMIDLAEALGAGVLVFGSPKNRLIGPRPADEADAIAVSTFRELGSYAASRRVSFCIEANPTDYGCDFVTTTAEAFELVRRVDSEGFALHVDTGGMSLSGENPESALADLYPPWRHFHVSEPYLAPIGHGNVDHRSFANVLGRRPWDGWISVEMKDATPDRPAADVVRESLALTRETYQGDPRPSRLSEQ